MKNISKSQYNLLKMSKNFQKPYWKTLDMDLHYKNEAQSEQK